MKFRKKPVVIESIQFLPDSHEHLYDLTFWMVENGADFMFGTSVDGRVLDLEIRTLEDGEDGRAKHVASPGDWIIKGVQGEFYPCKPDIFEQTYEAVQVW